VRERERERQREREDSRRVEPKKKLQGRSEENFCII
jgi:hypothetical protein